VKKLDHKCGELEDQFYLKLFTESYCELDHSVLLAEKNLGKETKSHEKFRTTDFSTWSSEKAQACKN